MKLGSGGGAFQKLGFDMTPMIDCCFQLLIFFMLTLKIVGTEGDFNIKMPLAAPSEGKPEDAQLPPVKVRLTAGPGGKLAGIRMGERSLKTFGELRKAMIDVVGNDRGPGSRAETLEVELDCDFDLRYEYVVEAITAVSGYPANDGQSIVKLIQKIKFSPRRGGGKV